MFQKHLEKVPQTWKNKSSFLRIWLKADCNRPWMLQTQMHLLHGGSSQYTSSTTRAPGSNTHKHFGNSGFDVFSQLLHGPQKINISFLSPMADLEEASVKQLMLSGNEIYFSRQTTSSSKTSGVCAVTWFSHGSYFVILKSPSSCPH